MIGEGLWTARGIDLIAGYMAARQSDFRAAMGSCTF